MDIVQFVDSVAASPTVRLNLNDGTTWGLKYDGTDLSPPPLKTAWASTLLVDGERLTAAAFGNRTLKLSLDLIAASPDTAAAQEQALWRELNRPTNLLKWQPDGASQPVFFQTIRSSANRVTDLPGSTTVLRLLDVQIEAKPFGIGLRETLATQDIVNNPASPNGHYLDLATIKGDADAPLYLQVRASDVNPVTFTIGEGRRTTAIAMRRGGTPSAMPSVLQAESMTVSGDTSLQAGIASSSGQFTRTTFAADTSLGNRMSTSAFPASPSTDARGQYRVFVRCRKSVDTDVVQIRMNYTTGGGTGVFTDTANVPSTGWRWVDLGVISIPLGYDPVTDGLSGVPVSVRGLLVNFSAGRVSGTGSLDVDVIMHMPADDRLCYIKWPQYGAQTNYVIDAVANQVYATGSSGEVMGTMLEMDSLPPMVSPGVANRVWLMRDVGAEYVSGDDIAASVRVTPYYYPQYLRVRPATT